MESFDVYREESVKGASREFFDPGMYTCDHPAWEALPGTWIEMPTLTSEVARLVDRNSITRLLSIKELNLPSAAERTGQSALRTCQPDDGEERDV
jgi:hypothetical protein